MFSLATPSVRSRVVVVITYCGGAIRLIYRGRREGGRENEQSLVVSLSLVDFYVVMNPLLCKHPRLVGKFDSRTLAVHVTS